MTPFTHTDKDGDRVHVTADDRYGALVEVTQSSPYTYGSYVPKDDAPAVALAILTAAGITASSLGGYDERAVWLLDRLATTRAAEKAKADAEAKLAEEALALLNAATDSCYADFPNETIRETWLRAARRARELHN
ncbi:hypothetical protein SEA_WARDA_54 [Arthrobacter phage Warda]|uniref:Uncharacterized protein n=1 Tax=Arthrobacter phage Warda TaxID=2832322 RepID=A0AA48Y494_9CAUD|nr:hypothetical protein PQE11_gp54 [Arthrobacter phage Warda]UIW13236.1 hypothetical protein SEA_WARDA_54 [Arthrobacter phage Warda]